MLVFLVTGIVRKILLTTPDFLLFVKVNFYICTSVCKRFKSVVSIKLKPYEKIILSVGAFCHSSVFHGQ